MSHKYIVKTGPDRWQIDMNDGKGGFRSGWIDFWIVEAIATVIRQIDNISKRVTVELIVEDGHPVDPTTESKR
jgi:hypothetical protein